MQKNNPDRIDPDIRCNTNTILLASATIIFMGTLFRFAGVEFEPVPIVSDPDSQLLLPFEIRLLATEY